MAKPAEEGPRLPDVEVKLSSGQDGNIFFVMGAITREMRRAGHGDLTSEFVEEFTRQPDYDKALQCAMRWVSVV